MFDGRHGPPPCVRLGTGGFFYEDSKHFFLLFLDTLNIRHL
jgi:hypothetical protein